MQTATMEQRAAFSVALRRFQEATALVAQTWEDMPADAIENYPSYLPSFDEFNSDVAGLRIRHEPNPIVEVGTRVVCVDYDQRAHHFTVEPGEFGTVMECNDDILRIKLDRHHDGASEWENEAVITPEDGADLTPLGEKRAQIQRYFEEHYAVLRLPVSA